MPENLPRVVWLILSALLARLLLLPRDLCGPLQPALTLSIPPWYHRSNPQTSPEPAAHPAPSACWVSRADIQQQKAIPPTNMFVSGAHGGDNAGPPSPPRHPGRLQAACNGRPHLKEMRLSPTERPHQQTTWSHEDFQVRNFVNRAVPTIQTCGGHWAGVWYLLYTC